MYQFFVEDTAITGDEIWITGRDVNHIKNVLRMKPGERVRISGKSSNSYFCELAEIGEERIRARIRSEDIRGTELSNRIILFQGLPKSDKMEWIIQKSVELGAAAVVPVAMKNCVVKLDDKRAEAKGKRWQQIAESAAKQSKRSVIPEVLPLMHYREAVSYAAELDIKLVPYENERGMTATREAVEAILPGMSVGIFIGPEGGFAPEEIALARECGMRTVSLGKRILRTETAGLAALTILMYHLENSMEWSGENGSISG